MDSVWNKPWYKKSWLKTGVTCSLLILMLTGCLPDRTDTTDELDLDLPPIDHAPTVYVQEDYYSALLPFVTSQARGTLDTYLGRYRLDAERLELGLLELAQDVFPTESHLYREGQFITKEEIQSWLRIQSDDYPLGLNPEDKDERVLLHILEHNYWDTRANALQGIVIGLSLAPRYTSVEEVGGNTETRQLYYSDDELRNYGQAMANKIAERLRGKLRNTEYSDIPIVFALYRLEEQDNLVPGNFLSTGISRQAQYEVSEWRTINEIYFLFPSGPLNRFENERSLTNATQFDEFRNQVQEYFPNYIGIVGFGRYLDENLVELTITANTEFAAKTEVIQLTQFLGGQAMELFPENVHLNIYVQSINEPQSIFIRPTEGEPIMHIYRK
ncbi:CamS family sex pheromone protein [Bacillus horti]|nr:CamS family sex pheromone protein [Bacillus horti]